jgi:HEAT repeat protein
MSCLLVALGTTRADEPDASLDDLIIALQNAASEDRVQAASALAKFGGDTTKAIPVLIETLDDPTPDARAAAAMTLGEIGEANDAVIAALLKRLEDEERREDKRPVWVFAAFSLGKLGPKVTPHLIARLESDKTNVRQGAAIALNGVGPDAAEAVPALIKLLDQDDPSTRRVAIYALHGIGKKSAAAMPSLMRMLDSQDFHAQYWSCRTIGVIGAPQAIEAVPKLIELTETAITSVRHNAAAALGEIGPEAGERVLAPLEALLEERIYPIRRSAVIALGKLGPFAERAAPAVRASLESSRSIRAEAACALWQMTGESEPGLSILLEELQSLDSPWESAKAFERLGKTAKLAVPQLIELLDSKNAETQLFAAYSIAGIGPAAKQALPALQQMLEDPEEDVRTIARETIKYVETDE